MRFQDSDVKVSCYRYAPEQFNASYKGKHIELSFDEISTCGNLMLCKGSKYAEDEIKRILRSREKRTGGKQFTYGFYVKDSKDTYIYCDSCKVSQSASIGDKLNEYRFIKRDLERRNSTVQTAWSAEIVAGQLQKQEKYKSIADLSRPLKVYFRYA